jgi:hypothetical protein
MDMNMCHLTRGLAGLVVVGAGISAAGIHLTDVNASLVWIWIGIVLQSALVLACLSWFKNRCSQRVATFLFLMQAATVTAGVWFNQESFAKSGSPFEAFTGYRLIALTIAVIAPPQKWLGALIISSVGLVMLIQYGRWMSSPSPITLSIQEPWLTLTYIIVAGFVYSYRLRTIKVERELVRVTTEAASMRCFANLMVQARHLANTPLQTIANTTELMRAQHPEVRPQLERIQRSLDRLEHLTHLLAYYEAHLSWKDVGQVIDYGTLERDILAELDKGVRASPAPANP